MKTKWQPHFKKGNKIFDAFFCLSELSGQGVRCNNVANKDKKNPMKTWDIASA
jgi:hypothetical protein